MEHESALPPEDDTVCGPWQTASVLVSPGDTPGWMAVAHIKEANNEIS